MQICKNCNTLMVGVMSFSKNKQERFDRCPKCFGETRHKTLRNHELNFGELLHKELHKNNI